MVALLRFGGNMAINWFEGGRRISHLFMGVAAVCGAGYVLFGASEDRLTFETANAGDGWHFTTKSCDYPDNEEFLDASYMIDGKSRPASLCFRTQDEKLLYMAAKPIELKTVGHAPKGMKAPVFTPYYTTDPYSMEARSYIVERARTFVPPAKEMEQARSDFWKIKWKRGWERANEATPWVFGGMFGIWLLTTILGWIIRGFAGIPAGRDFKPAPAEH